MDILRSCSICHSSCLSYSLPPICSSCFSSSSLKGGRSLASMYNPSGFSMTCDNNIYLSKFSKINFFSCPVDSRVSICFVMHNLKFYANLYKSASDSPYSYNPELNSILLNSGFIKTKRFSHIISDSCNYDPDIDIHLQDYYSIHNITPSIFYYKNIFDYSTHYISNIPKSLLKDYIAKLAVITKKLEQPDSIFDSSYTYYDDVFDTRDNPANVYSKILQRIRLQFDATCFHNFGHIPYVKKLHASFSKFAVSYYGIRNPSSYKHYPTFYMFKNNYIADITKDNMFLIKLSIEFLSSCILLSERCSISIPSLVNLAKIIAIIDFDPDGIIDIKYIIMFYVIFENFQVILNAIFEIFRTRRISNFEFDNFFNKIYSIISHYYFDLPPRDPSNITIIFDRLKTIHNPLAILHIMTDSFHDIFYTMKSDSSLVFSDPHASSDKPFTSYCSKKYAHFGDCIEHRFRSEDSCSIV